MAEIKGTVTSEATIEGNVHANPDMVVTKVQIENALGYTPADEEDLKIVDDKVDTLREVVSKFHSNIVEEASGEIITLSDSSEAPLQGLKLYGKTIQNGEPKPEEPSELESVGDNGSITVNVGVSETDENPQTVILSDIDGMCGIPVINKEGNYTDSDGVRWFCDEIDFEKGQYIQWIGKLVHDGVNRLFVDATGINDPTSRFKSTQSDGSIPVASYDCDNAISTHYQFNGFSSSASTSKVDRTFWFYRNNSVTNKGSGVYVYDTSFENAEAFNAYLKDYPMTVLYALREPIIHNLSEEVLAQFAELHTNYPNSTIYTDCGAGMDVKYIADTKLYVDKKFAELASAILNNV